MSRDSQEIASKRRKRAPNLRAQHGYFSNILLIFDQFAKVKMSKN